MSAGAEDDGAVAPWWYSLLFIGVTGAAASLTVLFRSMRAVMETGASSCASGGPYAIANPCPKGVAAMTPISIWAGIAFVGLASIAAMKVRWPSIAWLAWPALFLSLGWNFWEFGLGPPGDHAIDWGWVICGALFVVMGGGPLVLWFANPQDRPGASGTARAAIRATEMGTKIRAATTPPPFREAAPSSWTPEASDADDLVVGLERLAQLHREGALDDDEFAAAKATLIGGGR